MNRILIFFLGFNLRFGFRTLRGLKGFFQDLRSMKATVSIIDDRWPQSRHDGAMIGLKGDLRGKKERKVFFKKKGENEVFFFFKLTYIGLRDNVILSLVQQAPKRHHFNAARGPDPDPFRIYVFFSRESIFHIGQSDF